MRMGFFRRPHLIGTNVSRLGFGSVRGSVRRSDPDVNSQYPYFPGLNISDTLILEIDGTEYTVTFTGTSMSQVLSDVNGVLGSAGKATDEDGVVSIRTSTGGPSGTVKISGGTAAKALGLNPLAGPNAEIFSRGGDIASAPEGREGAVFGTMGIGRRENVVSSSLNRALAGISGNVDSLYTDVVKSSPRLASVFSGSAEGNYVQLSGRVYTGGLQKQSSGGTKEQWSGYFLVLDQVTKEPLPFRAVGLSAVIPSDVNYPLNNDTASGPGGEDGGNVAGLDAQLEYRSISEVISGTTVRVAGGSVSPDLVGYPAQIVGSTNTTPWSNEGSKWVVEGVSQDYVTLRPASTSELTEFGAFYGQEHQPVLELNQNKGTGESFGSLAIMSKGWVEDPVLIINPPIPKGSQVEIWAFTPGSVRDTTSLEDIRAKGLMARFSQPYSGTLGDGILSGLTPSKEGSYLQLTEGRIRYNGRSVRIPARQYLAEDFQSDGDSLVVWSSAQGQLLILTSWADSLNEGDLGASVFPISKVTTAGGSISQVLDLRRLAGNLLGRVTVGAGGQFALLESALEWMDVQSQSSLYSKWDILLVSDVSTAGLGELRLPSKTRISASRPDLTLTLGGTDHLTVPVGGELFLDGLKIGLTSQRGPIYVDGSSDVVLRDVRIDRAQSRANYLIRTDTANMLDPVSLTVYGGDLYIAGGIADITNMSRTDIFGSNVDVPTGSYTTVYVTSLVGCTVSGDIDIRSEIIGRARVSSNLFTGSGGVKTSGVLVTGNTFSRGTSSITVSDGSVNGNYFKGTGTFSASLCPVTGNSFDGVTINSIDLVEFSNNYVTTGNQEHAISARVATSNVFSSYGCEVRFTLEDAVVRGLVILGESSILRIAGTGTSVEGASVEGLLDVSGNGCRITDLTCEYLNVDCSGCRTDGIRVTNPTNHPMPVSVAGTGHSISGVVSTNQFFVNSADDVRLIECETDGEFLLQGLDSSSKFSLQGCKGNSLTATFQVGTVVTDSSEFSSVDFQGVELSMRRAKVGTSLTSMAQTNKLLECDLQKAVLQNDASVVGCTIREDVSVDGLGTGTAEIRGNELKFRSTSNYVVIVTDCVNVVVADNVYIEPDPGYVGTEFVSSAVRGAVYVDGTSEAVTVTNNVVTLGKLRLDTDGDTTAYGIHLNLTSGTALLVGNTVRIPLSVGGTPSHTYYGFHLTAAKMIVSGNVADKATVSSRSGQTSYSIAVDQVGSHIEMYDGGQFVQTGGSYWVKS